MKLYAVTFPKQKTVVWVTGANNNIEAIRSAYLVVPHKNGETIFVGPQKTIEHHPGFSNLEVAVGKELD